MAFALALSAAPLAAQDMAPGATNTPAPAAEAAAPERQFVIIEKGPGKHQAVEAVKIEESRGVVTITDGANKLYSTMAAKIKAKLPVAPASAEGLTREAVEAALKRIDEAAAAHPGAEEGLKPNRAQWEDMLGQMKVMEDQKAQIAAKVTAYLTAIDETAQHGAQEVEAKIQEGEQLIKDAPDREAEIQPQIEAWRKRLAPAEPMQAQGMEGEKKPEQPAKPPIAAEDLQLAKDFKIKMPESALRPNVMMAGLVTVIMSTMFFIYSAMHGLGRLLRLKASAFLYLGIGVGGLGLYFSVGLMLLEIPEDYPQLKKHQQGDPTLIESVVAFAQKYPQIQGDTAPFAHTDIQDGSLNAFLTQRLEFVPRQPATPLDVKRRSLLFDMRQDGILIYTDLLLLGAPVVGTLFVPVSARDDEMVFGEARGRLGNVTMPRPLARVFWSEFQDGVVKALEEAKLSRAYAIQRVSDHAMQLVLKP